MQESVSQLSLDCSFATVTNKVIGLVAAHLVELVTPLGLQALTSLDTV